jgi:hypothetical protein
VAKFGADIRIILLRLIGAFSPLGAIASSTGERCFVIFVVVFICYLLFLCYGLLALGKLK